MMINLDRHICKAKRKDNGRWVKGYYVALRDTTYCFKEDCDTHPDNTKHYIVVDKMTDWGLPNEHYWVEVDPETVCQCTGWHDSNKTPIFEKDIVEFVGPNTHRDLIWWCNEMSMMTAIPLDDIKFNGYDYWNGNYPNYTYADFCFMMQDPYGDFREIRVVGNIVDHPELLEVSK